MNPQYQNVLPAPPKKNAVNRFSPKLLIVIIGVVVALLLAGALLIASASNSPVVQMQRLSARFESLRLIIDEGSKGVQGGDLKKVQSDASILVRGDVANVTTAMQRAGLGKVSGATVALESDKPTLDALVDAKLNGKFDTAYKKALSQKLESTMALMREVNNKTSSRELKSALTTAYDHFGSLLDQLAKL